MAPETGSSLPSKEAGSLERASEGVGRGRRYLGVRSILVEFKVREGPVNLSLPVRFPQLGAYQTAPLKLLVSQAIIV